MEIQRCIMPLVRTYVFITCIPSFGIASLQREMDHFRKASEVVLNFKAAKGFYVRL
jgi:hypothetical protein